MKNKGMLKSIIFITVFFLTFNIYAEEKITYKNTKFNFSIIYPSSWTMTEGASGTIVSFSIPPYQLGEFGKSVQVGFEDLVSPQISLEQYESEMLAVRQMPGVKLLEKGKTEIDGKETFFFVLLYDTDAMPKMKQKVCGFIADSKLYTLSYIEDKDAFDTYLPQAENIIKSFKFIK